MSDSFTLTRRGYVFEWAGGPYIEIARATSPGEPFEVINVSGTVEPFTRVGLVALVDEWQSGFESGAAAFRHLADVAHNTLDY